MTTYKIITINNILGEGYWIQKTKPKKFLFWKWNKTEIIGAYKWGAEESGSDCMDMPFFSLESAQERLKELENGS